METTAKATDRHTKRSHAYGPMYAIHEYDDSVS